MGVVDRLKGAWNAFREDEKKAALAEYDYSEPGYGGIVTYGNTNPSRPARIIYNDKSIVSAIYTRIAVDFASIDLRHIQLDDKKRYSDDVKSMLNKALEYEPNLDQGPRAFRQDLAHTLFDKGVAAIVPVDTKGNPEDTENFDIYTLRVAEVVNWYPKHVRLRLYNEAKGTREEITLPKRMIAIIENPLYDVMNEPNSTLQRLLRKLSLLDAVDEQSGSGKLDLIIQLPYVIKSEARRQQAEQRRQDIEFQLKGSQYGIAYTDGTEKITQLNRPAENQLMKQIEYLIAMLYDQLGVTEEIMNGTADEKAMINYFSRTIEPLLDASAEAMQRSFLGPMKFDKGQRIMYFRDVFKLVPLSEIAEIADKFTRNEILSSNEVRQYMGLPPSKDPKADELVNSNMPVQDTGAAQEASPTGTDTEALETTIKELTDEMDKIVTETLDGVEKDVDELVGGADAE